MNEELKIALQELRQAVQNEGRNPTYHRILLKKHRDQWPTLWNAIDKLMALSDTEIVKQLTN